jgi:hypothetical protein
MKNLSNIFEFVSFESNGWFVISFVHEQIGLDIETKGSNRSKMNV